MPGFDDRMMTSDCLASQKYISGAYNMAAEEAASPDLKRVFLDIHRQEQDSQLMLFNAMTKRNWYNVPAADPQSITNALNMLRQV
ncbi:MAG TPA: spore coat protein [Firmicutes bacterium]|nr:spore coat protein [Bacillota bacterium]